MIGIFVPIPKSQASLYQEKSPSLMLFFICFPSMPSVGEGFPPLIPVDAQFSQQTSQVGRHLDFLSKFQQTFPTFPGYLEDVQAESNMIQLSKLSKFRQTC